MINEVKLVDGCQEIEERLEVIRKKLNEVIRYLNKNGKENKEN